jgi:hypothetical protein
VVNDGMIGYVNQEEDPSRPTNLCFVPLVTQYPEGGLNHTCTLSRYRPLHSPNSSLTANVLNEVCTEFRSRMAAKQEETAFTAGVDLVESNKEWYSTAVEIASDMQEEYKEEYKGVIIDVRNRGVLLTEDAAERSAQRSVTSA